MTLRLFRCAGHCHGSKWIVVGSYVGAAPLCCGLPMLRCLVRDRSPCSCEGKR